MTTASMRGCICYLGIFLTSILLVSSASAQLTNVTGDQASPSKEQATTTSTC